MPVKPHRHAPSVSEALGRRVRAHLRLGVRKPGHGRSLTTCCSTCDTHFLIASPSAVALFILRCLPLTVAILTIPKFYTPKTKYSTISAMGSLHDSRIHKWFATSPPVAWTVRQLRELLIGSLKQGPIPQHVAFVMDGNRRFARNHHIETVEGHNLGFESLARVCTSSTIPYGRMLTLE
jgi:hypothetical protein